MVRRRSSGGDCCRSISRPWRQKSRGLPPLCNLAPQLLLEKLVADYLFALLTEAAVELTASENAARFAAMGSAHDNVSKKLEELRQEARQARQSGGITSELLDLVTGTEASNGGSGPSLGGRTV